MAQRRDILLTTRSSNNHRTLEEPLQHETTTQCIGLSPTCAGSKHPGGQVGDQVGHGESGLMKKTEVAGLMMAKAVGRSQLDDLFLGTPTLLATGGDR
ncbi:MAG: hypothetical protein ACI9IV_001848 [Paracoccaceae bacterium]